MSQAIIARSMAPVQEAKGQRFVSVLCRYPYYFFETSVEKDKDEESEKERIKRKSSPLFLHSNHSLLGEGGFEEKRWV